MKYLLLSLLFYSNLLFANNQVIIDPVSTENLQESQYYSLKNEVRINELTNHISKLEGQIKQLDAKYIQLQINLEQLTSKGSTLPDNDLNNDPEFEYAFQMLNKAQYKISYRAFKLFIEKYPEDKKVGEAYFWLGEISYKSKDYVDASKNYLISYRDYQNNNDRRNDALFKLSIVLGIMDKKSESCSGFDILIHDSPNITPSLKSKALTEAINFGCTN
jgi:TolA-binding protein